MMVIGISIYFFAPTNDQTNGSSGVRDDILYKYILISLCVIIISVCSYVTCKTICDGDFEYTPDRYLLVDPGDGSPINYNAIAIPISRAITVTTQVQPGQMIDNSCKICIDNGWDIALACGHLICSECFNKLELVIGQSWKECPFCREVITNTYTVIYP